MSRTTMIGAAGGSGLAVTLLAGTALAGDPAVHAVLFESLDAGPSYFATTGVKAAPDGVDRKGLAFLAALGSGLRFERSPARASAPSPTLVRMTLSGAALTGYQFFADWGVVSLFTGPEVSLESLGGRTLPTRYGLRLHGEVWARPTEDTLATATLILGSARWDLYARVSWGARAFGAYLGPEFAHYRDATGYRKWQLGAHATDFAIGPLRLRASAGCQYETETKRAAPYLSLAGWITL